MLPLLVALAGTDPRLRRGVLQQLMARTRIGTEPAAADDPIQKRLGWVQKTYGVQRARWIEELLRAANVRDPQAGIFAVLWLAGRSADREERIAAERACPMILEISDWLRAERLENLQDLTVADALARSTAWHATVAPRAEGVKPGEVVLRYHGELEGWTAQKLSTRKQLESEGHAMTHCVGRGSYVQAVAEGSSIICSLRDPEGVPRLTVQVSAPDMRLVQARGVKNALPDLRMSRAAQDLVEDLRSKAGLIESERDRAGFDPSWEIMAAVGDGHVLVRSASPPPIPFSRKHVFDVVSSGSEKDGAPYWSIVDLRGRYLLTFQLADRRPIGAYKRGYAPSWFRWSRMDCPSIGLYPRSLADTVDYLRLQGHLPDVRIGGRFVAERPGFQLRAVSGSEANAIAAWCPFPILLGVQQFGPPWPESDSLLLVLSTSLGSPLGFYGAAPRPTHLIELSPELRFVRPAEGERPQIPSGGFFCAPQPYYIEIYDNATGYPERAYHHPGEGHQRMALDMLIGTLAEDAIGRGEAVPIAWWIAASILRTVREGAAARAAVRPGRATGPSAAELMDMVTSVQGRSKTNLLSPEHVALFERYCRWALDLAFEHGIPEEDVSVEVVGATTGSHSTVQATLLALRKGIVTASRGLFFRPMDGPRAPCSIPRALIEIVAPFEHPLVQDDLRSAYPDKVWLGNHPYEVHTEWDGAHYVKVKPRGPLPGDPWVVVVLDRHLVR